MRPPTRTTRSSSRVPLPVAQSGPIPATDVEKIPKLARRQTEPNSLNKLVERVPYQRHRLGDRQTAALRALFESDTHPTAEEKAALAERVGISTNTVTYWSQNRRQAVKKQQNSSNSPTVKCASKKRDVPSVDKSLDDKAFVVSPVPRILSENSPLQHVSSPALNASLRLARPRIRLSARGNFDYDSNASVSTDSPTGTLLSQSFDDRNSYPSSPGASSDTSSSLHSYAGRASTAPLYHVVTPEDTSGKRNNKRILEWACDRQTKRRRSDSDQGQLSDGDLTETDDEHSPPKRSFEMHNESYLLGGHPAESALSLLSLAGSTRLDVSQDVLSGAALLLGFKHAVRVPHVKLDFHLAGEVF